MELGVAVTIAAIICFFVGAALGAVVASMHLKKQIKENPPFNEEQIRELYRQTGRKLSETQVKRIMKSLEQQKN